MGRIIGFLYGMVAYCTFLVALLYAIGFVGNMVVPKSIDSGAMTAGSVTWAFIINLVLLGIFAIQHSVMARPGFKAAWAKIVPESIERSTYVLISSLLLGLLYWQWQPLAGAGNVVWSVTNPAASMVLTVVFFIGWGVVLASSFMISHWELFGVSQSLALLKGKTFKFGPYKAPTLFYKLARHPLMTGFFIAFWATPHMTVGHLLFTLTVSAYVLIALQLEERDLVDMFGDKYRKYQRQVPMLIPFLKFSRKETGKRAAAGKN